MAVQVNTLTKLGRKKNGLLIGSKVDKMAPKNLERCQDCDTDKHVTQYCTECGLALCEDCYSDEGHEEHDDVGDKDEDDEDGDDEGEDD